MKKTLILRFSSLGDVAMIVPVIRCLCKKYPNEEFIIVSREKFKPLFEEHQNLSFFRVDFDNRHKGFLGVFKLFKDLKKIRPNKVADLHPRGPMNDKGVIRGRETGAYRFPFVFVIGMPAACRSHQLSQFKRPIIGRLNGAFDEYKIAI